MRLPLLSGADLLEIYAAAVVDGLPGRVVEQGDNDDGDVGEHEHREGDGVENFLGGGAIDIVPLGDGGDNAKDEHGEV